MQRAGAQWIIDYRAQKRSVGNWTTKIILYLSTRTAIAKHAIEIDC